MLTGDFSLWVSVLALNVAMSITYLLMSIELIQYIAITFSGFKEIHMVKIHINAT